MIKRINKFFNDFYDLKARIEAFFEPNTEVSLMRRILGSIDSRSDFQEPAGSERKEFIGRVETVFEDVDKVFKAMVDDQKDLMAHEAIDVSFARGTMNGIELAREKFESWHGEYIESKKKETAPSIGGAIPSLNISPFPAETHGQAERS
jgi:hypothetical protein